MYFIICKSYKFKKTNTTTILAILEGIYNWHKFLKSYDSTNVEKCVILPLAIANSFNGQSNQTIQFPMAFPHPLLLRPDVSIILEAKKAPKGLSPFPSLLLYPNHLHVQSSSLLALNLHYHFVLNINQVWDEDKDGERGCC